MLYTETQKQLDSMYDAILINETHFTVHKIEDTAISPGHCYIIKLKNFILHEPENFTLSTNWNKGIVPSSKWLKIDVIKMTGKMILVNACGFDDNNQKDKNDIYVDFWLPLGGIDEIRKCD